MTRSRPAWRRPAPSPATTGAGTDAKVHIEIFGTEGSSGKLTLPPELNGRSCYARAQVDSFTMKLTPVLAGKRVPRHLPDFSNASKNHAYVAYDSYWILSYSTHSIYRYYM